MRFSQLLCLWLLACLLLACGKHITTDKHGNRYYSVQKGDTLYAVGRRFHLSYQTLAKRNHLSPPYEIYIGQQLSIDRSLPHSRRAAAQKKTIHHARSRKAPKAVHKASLPSLQWPLKGKISSPFGRRHGRMHDGIDIKAAEGAKVYAAAAGLVVYADHRLAGYGNLIIIRHHGDVFTSYAHNRRNLVAKGDRVKRGQWIARVGHTGRATGSHLHFEVRRASTPVDPLRYLPKRH